MRFRELLRLPDYRRLWVGQICSQLGDRLTQMILIAIVGTRFPGSTLAMAGIMSWTVIPAFLVSPFAGAFVDRWDRRRTMLVCDVARAICVLALPAVALWPTMAATDALVFLLFAIACFFLPARLALLPSLVSPAALVAANSLMTTSGMIGATSCMLLGGVLVERVGIKASCAAAMASYLGSAACVFAIEHRPAPRTSTSGTMALLRDIREGLLYAFGQLHSQFVLTTLFVVSAASGAIFVLATVMVQQALGTVTRDLGIFSVTMGLGLFAGTVLHGRFGQRWDKPRLILWCLAGCGAALLGFAVGVGHWHSAAAGWATTALLGLVAAPIGTAVNAMIHELVHGRLWGRVFSAMGIVMNAAMLIGLWLAGGVAERLTPVVTLAILGGLLILGAIGALAAILARRPRPAVL